MNINQMKVLLSPDAAEGHEEDEHLEEGVEGQNDGTTSEVQTSEDKSDKGTGLSQDDITSILSKVIPATAPEPQRQERQYTQDEIDKMLNVWKPDQAFLKRIGIAEPNEDNLKAIQELRDSLVRQANTMSEARIQQLLTEKLAEFADVKQYISEQRAAETTNAFYSKYDNLKPYEEIVDAVSARLEKQGFKSNSRDSIFSEIAKGTEAVLKRMNITPGKSNGSNAGKTRMASLAGGGQGGAGSSGSKRKPDMAIFDPVDE